MRRNIPKHRPPSRFLGNHAFRDTATSFFGIIKHFITDCCQGVFSVHGAAKHVRRLFCMFTTSRFSKYFVCGVSSSSSSILSRATAPKSPIYFLLNCTCLRTRPFGIDIKHDTRLCGRRRRFDFTRPFAFTVRITAETCPSFHSRLPASRSLRTDSYGRSAPRSHARKLGSLLPFAEAARRRARYTR